jgi:hypothetical protein
MACLARVRVKIVERMERIKSGRGERKEWRRAAGAAAETAGAGLRLRARAALC